MAAGVAPCHSHGVDLIEKDDAGSGGAGFAEDFADVIFRVADKLGDELWPFDGEEVEARFRSQSFGSERFGTTRRAVRAGSRLLA